MCGVFGMVSLTGQPISNPGLLPEMGRSLRHRGPDGSGLKEGPSFGLGCERLRIVDLHERADQPFHDPRTGTTLACNGEIYNAADFRRRYGDYPYRSASDVETILPLYADRGIDGIADIDGMFGLAVWVERDRTLILARDRAGEKPLFYSRIGDEIWFASELQALLLNPAVSRELDQEALIQYLTLGYVLEPRTMFRDIRRIEAGTIAAFDPSGLSVRRYWDPMAIATSSPTSDEGSTDLERLRELVDAAVRKQVWAEVPVGVFISGGLDSTLLTTLAARKVGVGGIHTFAARFDDGSYDESADAAVYARRLGTVHHEVPINEDSMAEALSAVAEGLAEPVADPAILPTFLLAREARKHVKVILSGEGADELFGGYPTYIGHKLAPYLGGLPSPMRALVRGGVERLPASRRKVTFEFLLKRFVRGADKPWIDRHLAWFGTGIQGGLAKGSELGDQPTDVLPESLGLASMNGSSSAPLFDYCTYLRDNLLVKVDRATMLNSVEARAPFLDRDLSAFALALPADLKVKRLTTKWLLKKAALEWLPKATVYRKKRGLSVPVASWIDRGLRAEVDRLLEPERLHRQDLLDAERVGHLLAEHRSGEANHARPLWALVVLQYWLERWVPERAAGETGSNS